MVFINPLIPQDWGIFKAGPDCIEAPLFQMYIRGLPYLIGKLYNDGGIC
jgi:hypothetical protein